MSIGLCSLRVFRMNGDFGSVEYIYNNAFNKK